MNQGSWLIGRFNMENKHLMDENPESEEGNEFHAILSILKAISGWWSTKAIQSCRECCGGHGYSALSMFGKIKDANDVHNTWEGDNNVLI